MKMNTIFISLITLMSSPGMLMSMLPDSEPTKRQKELAYKVQANHEKLQQIYRTSLDNKHKELETIKTDLLYLSLMRYKAYGLRIAAASWWLASWWFEGGWGAIPAALIFKEVYRNTAYSLEDHQREWEALRKKALELIRDASNLQKKLKAGSHEGELL